MVRKILVLGVMFAAIATLSGCSSKPSQGDTDACTDWASAYSKFVPPTPAYSMNTNVGVLTVFSNLMTDYSKEATTVELRDNLLLSAKYFAQYAQSYAGDLSVSPDVNANRTVYRTCLKLGVQTKLTKSPLPNWYEGN